MTAADVADGPVLKPGEDTVAALLRHFDRHMSLPTPKHQIIARELNARDPQLVEKLMVAIDDTTRPVADRERLVSVLAALGPAAAPAVPRLVGMAFGTRPLPLTAEEDVDLRRKFPQYPKVPDYVPGRNSALAALQQVGPSATPALVEVLKTGTPEQARYAAFALKMNGRDANLAAPALLDRLRRAEEPEDVIELLRTIEEVDPASLRSKVAQATKPKVLEAAQGGEPGLSEEAIALLPALGVPAREAVPATVHAMAQVLRADPRGGLGALVFFDALGQYRLGARPELTKLAADADPKVRQAAVYAFASEGVATARDVSLLARILRDDADADVRFSAAATLGHLGSLARAAAPQLEAAAARDGSPEVRNAAKQALEQIKS